MTINPLFFAGAAAAAGLVFVAGSDPLNLYTEESDGPVDYDKNLYAFLAVLRAGESSNNYGALVGGGEISDFSHHPATGQNPWPGIIWPSTGQPTHAAGAYQFQPGTWLECVKALGLKDFGIDSQDAAAIYLIKRRGAYRAVLDGNVALARNLLVNEWASLADRGYDWVAETFTEEGGVLA